MSMVMEKIIQEKKQTKKSYIKQKYNSMPYFMLKVIHGIHIILLQL